MIEAKKRMISYLQEDIKELKISNQRFTKHLQYQSDKITKITVWLMTGINSRKKLKILLKERQDSIKMLFDMVEIIEDRETYK